MIKIISSNDIIWKRIEKNENVIEFIENVNDFLSTYDGKEVNSIQLKVELKEKYSVEEYDLIKFAFSQFGWNINFSYHYNKESGNYILGCYLSLKN